MLSIKKIVVFCLFFAMTSCSHRIPLAEFPQIERDASWAQLPIINLTEVPHAGKRVSSILSSELHRKKISGIKLYPIEKSVKDYSPNKMKPTLSEKSQDWALSQGARYAISGTIEEWYYRVGIDGEPVVSLSLNIVDLWNGDIIWSQSDSEVGRTQQTLAEVSQTMIHKMLSRAYF